MHTKNEEKRTKKKKNSRKINVICVTKVIPMPLPVKKKMAPVIKILTKFQVDLCIFSFVAS
jgi:hypothetical protein